MLLAGAALRCNQYSGNLDRGPCLRSSQLAAPFCGLGLYGLHFTGGLSHLGVALVNGTYNSGALTAALVQLPLSCMRRRGMAVLILAGQAVLQGIAGVAAGSIGTLLVGFVKHSIAQHRTMKP
jgi:hypothetical protein